MSGLRTVAVILVLGIILVVATTRPEPKEFVEERTVEIYSDVFFTYNLIRYPAAAEIRTGGSNFTLGVNVGTDRLDFGVVLGKGSSVKKEINLTSRDEKSSKVTLTAYGSIKPLLSFSRNDFVLSGKGSVAVSLNTGDQPGGNYTGEIDVIVQRSRHEFLGRILGY